MQISSRFTLAIHVIAAIDIFQKDQKVTSDLLASSTNTNPVIIRRLLGKLKQAELVNVARGTGGATLTKKLKDITFLDIYNAIDAIEDDQLFHFHENPNSQCPVGKNIHNALDGRLSDIQITLEKKLSSITMADVVKDIENNIKL